MNAATNKETSGKQIKTGIKEFDELLNGGITAGSTILVLGPPRKEKEIFVEQILFNGKNEKTNTIIITTDNSLETTKKTIKRFGWKLDPKKTSIIDAYSWTFEQKHNTEDLSNLNMLSVKIKEECEKFAATKNTCFLVIDSLSTLLLYNPPDAVFRFIHALRAMIKKHSMVLFALLSKNMFDKNIEITAEHLTDFTLEFRREETKNYIRVRRHAVRLEDEWLPFDLIDSGLALKLKYIEKNFEEITPKKEIPS
ncbi:MAG: hypothetical protein J7K00_04290 [Candidatus Diapherotrites archaeon]|nr:hypothetical protein [Candidatus Diapherotrites archaeon]